MFLRTPLLIIMGLLPAASLAAAPAASDASGSKGTCAQVTKAQVQTLMAPRITKVTVKSVPGFTYLVSAKRVGQQCVYAAGPSDSDALSVTVVSGPAAARAYASDVQGLGARPVPVPGVGDKAVRARVDAKGAVGTAMITSIKGSTYCSVTPQTEDIPGVAKLEQAAGDTADIGNKAYAAIAAAIGTVCNRIYGSGNTKPDLRSLRGKGSKLRGHAASAAPPCVAKIVKLNGKKAVENCGPATVILKAAGKTYNFSKGLCSQSKSAGAALELGLGTLVTGAHGNAGKPYLNMLIAKSKIASIFEADSGGKQILGDSLITAHGNIPSKGSFTGENPLTGAHFSGSWNCHGVVFKTP